MPKYGWRWCLLLKEDTLLLTQLQGVLHATAIVCFASWLLTMSRRDVRAIRPTAYVSYPIGKCVGMLWQMEAISLSASEDMPALHLDSLYLLPAEAASRVFRAQS